MVGATARVAGRHGAARGSRILTAAVFGALAYAGLWLREAYGRSFALGYQRGGRHPLSLRQAEVAEKTATTEGEETFEFQAEVNKVMDIIINSLYSNKDVFLRELVSNAADACDKKRFLALTESEAPPESMKLRIRSDKEARTLSIEDNG